ncbi:hypothetical protein N9955_00310 [bacterium]|nr:hypothetical protein [bacterium]
MKIGPYFKIELTPWPHWFWKSYSRYSDYPDIVDVFGGGPFFQYEYWEDYDPIKHKNVRVTKMM